MPAFSAVFRERHPYLIDFLDLDEADEQAELLRTNALQVLNDRVLESPSSEVLDVVAEHNVAAMLLRLGFSGVQYEPSAMSRPVDLVGDHGGRGYRIEVKRLSASAHDHLHSNVMKTLNAALASHDEPVALSLRIAEPFEARDINPLVRHVKQSLRDWREGEAYYFPSATDWLVSYTFGRSTKAGHPRVAAAGDADMRNVTGVDQARVRGKVTRAHDQFKAAPADDALHLVVLAMDKTIHLHSVSEALYGREYVVSIAQGGERQGRYDDGLFCRGQHSRLGGVVVARRVEYWLFVPYNFVLFPNPVACLPVGEVVGSLGIGEVLGPDNYP